jgi:hypothetical protein
LPVNPVSAGNAAPKSAGEWFQKVDLPALKLLIEPSGSAMAS